MKLPVVLFQDGEYRFVALKTTTEKPAIHAAKWILNSGYGEFYHVVSEKKSIDSLGGEKWDQCNTQEAQENIVRVLLLKGLGSTSSSPKKLLTEEQTTTVSKSVSQSQSKKSQE